MFCTFYRCLLSSLWSKLVDGQLVCWGFVVVVYVSCVGFSGARKGDRFYLLEKFIDLKKKNSARHSFEGEKYQSVRWMRA